MTVRSRSTSDLSNSTVSASECRCNSKIASQSDAQSGHLSTAELTTLRDNNLVALLRALKQQGAAAGKLLAEHDKSLTPPPPPPGPEPLVTLRRTIPVDWTDYNGHMNESRYGQVYSDATDATMVAFGADADYVADGLSYFTVENLIKYQRETHAGDSVHVTTRILLADGKKLKLLHEMRSDGDGEILSTCEQFLLHVSLETRQTCAPRADIAQRLAALATAHREVPA